MPGSAWKASLQNPKQYLALKKEGFSKEAAARISNAKTAGTKVVKNTKWKSAKEAK
jgi:hypothetical protein